MNKAEKLECKIRSLKAELYTTELEYEKEIGVSKYPEMLLTNDEIAKMVKMGVKAINQISESQEEGSIKSSATMCAGLIVITTLAEKANAEKITGTIEGITLSGKDFGNWKVTVEKIIDENS